MPRIRLRRPAGPVGPAPPGSTLGREEVPESSHRWAFRRSAVRGRRLPARRGVTHPRRARRVPYGGVVEPHAGRLHVHYGQAYVLCGDRELPDLEDAFRGQVNGLCGASALGALFLVTGLHTGMVGFAVQVL